MTFNKCSIDSDDMEEKGKISVVELKDDALEYINHRYSLRDEARLKSILDRIKKGRI